ncbi:transcriptional regulator, partial [Streptomyces sp. MBT57]|nr:transcriptional regulator [Streptomyces sp. MBT57]
MEPNVLLESLIDEAGMSRAGLAGHINRAGRARGLSLRYEHTAVSRWLKGQRPRGQVPDLICEVLGGRLGRPVALDDIGMGISGGHDTGTAPH